MSLALLSCLSRFAKNAIIPTQYAIQVNNYAIPSIGGKLTKKGKRSMVPEKKTLPVETDVNRLLTYVCGTNILKEGGEDVKIKVDSEYPDWLWDIRIGPAKPLEELDPNSKSYWRRVRKMALKRNNLKASYKKF